MAKAAVELICEVRGFRVVGEIFPEEFCSISSDATGIVIRIPLGCALNESLLIQRTLRNQHSFTNGPDGVFKSRAGHGLILQEIFNERNSTEAVDGVTHQIQAVMHDKMMRNRIRHERGSFRRANAKNHNPEPSPHAMGESMIFADSVVTDCFRQVDKVDHGFLLSGRVERFRKRCSLFPWRLFCRRRLPEELTPALRKTPGLEQ